MPVDPADFNTHAERVGDSYQDEIAFRNIISRKYYYVFHLVREQNRTHEQSRFTGYGDHAEASEFIERLGYHELADTFDDLRNKRNDADYELEQTFDDMDVAIFENDLEEFIAGAKRKNIIE